jgi:uncharacterized protein YjbJ (UPF0337 family)
MRLGQGDILMNMDIVEGKWKEVRGKVQQQWGDLTDSDLDQIAGRRTELEGLLQKRYGYTKERAQREVDEFLRDM